MLVLALENFLSAARLPRALQDAGFQVGVICYADSLLALTRFVDRRSLLRQGDTAECVAERLIDLIDEMNPAVILPADERALRFMHHVVEVKPLGRLPRALTDLVERSLPEPWAFELSQNKWTAAEFVKRLGISVPAQHSIKTGEEAVRFAESHGYPVILKPHQGRGGSGMTICHCEAEVEAFEVPPAGCIIQEFVEGPAAESSGIAWQGRLLGTICYEKTVMHPPHVGQSAVVTVIEHLEMVRHLAAIAKATRHSGILSVSWMLDDARTPQFLEVNARCVPIIGPSGKLGLNLCACLYSKLVGAPAPKPDPKALGSWRFIRRSFTAIQSHRTVSTFWMSRSTTPTCTPRWKRA